MTQQLAKQRLMRVFFVGFSFLFVSGFAHSLQAQDVILSTVPQSNADKEYVLTFAEFTPTAISEWQTFIRHYSGYKVHSINLQNAQVMRLRYSTTAGKELLINNIQKTADYLGLVILIRSEENLIDVRFIQSLPKSLPYKEW